MPKATDRQYHKIVKCWFEFFLNCDDNTLIAFSDVITDVSAEAQEAFAAIIALSED